MYVAVCLLDTVNETPVSRQELELMELEVAIQSCLLRGVCRFDIFRPFKVVSDPIDKRV